MKQATQLPIPFEESDFTPEGDESRRDASARRQDFTLPTYSVNLVEAMFLSRLCRYRSLAVTFVQAVLCVEFCFFLTIFAALIGG
jgi:hypothetical protein